MIAVNFLQLALILMVVVYLTLNMLHLVRVESARGPLVDPPQVSVCVPARNEERDIEACLTSLLEQDYPDFEVIVVDDHSTDNTPAIIASLQKKYPHLVALRSAELPPDWYGKPFALHQAQQKARGEVLLFTDADPVFQPHALVSAVHLMTTRKLDLLSLMPAAEFGSFWERVVQPLIFAFIAGLTRFKKVNSVESSSAMGVGAFIMVRREVYDRVGGHESLRQAILEDIGLAKRVKTSGASIMIADAKDQFSIRMYHSLQEIWVGWRKNIFLALRRSILKTFYYVFIVLGFVVTPWLWVGYHSWAGSVWWLQMVSWIGLGLVLMTELGLCHELRLKPYNLLLFPLGAVIMCGILINSMIHILFKGRSEWRGRTYHKPT